MNSIVLLLSSLVMVSAASLAVVLPGNVPKQLYFPFPIEFTEGQQSTTGTHIYLIY